MRENFFVRDEGSYQLRQSWYFSILSVNSVLSVQSIRCFCPKIWDLVLNEIKNLENLRNFRIVRSSHPEVFLGKGVLKICSKFTGENQCRSAISVKLQSDFLESLSPVNLLHIFVTPFPKNTSGCYLFRICKRYLHSIG